MTLPQSLIKQFEVLNPFTLPVVSIPHRHKLPEISAIYFVLSNSNELFYIGQTENLKKRWHRHECGIELESPKKTNIAWVEVEEGNYRKKLESLLIRKYKPSLNRVSKKPKKKRKFICKKLLVKKEIR